MKRIHTDIENVDCYVLPSGAEIVRFNNLSSALNYDLSPQCLEIGISARKPQNQESSSVQYYLRNRRNLDKRKKDIIVQARKSLSLDKEFLKLIYKSKSSERTYQKNKFGGNLSIPRYAAQSKEIFNKRKPGKKKATIDMAFQVGTLLGGDYGGGFTKIVKAILSAQALGISLNIDMFDSDRSGTGKESYSIVRVADSRKKLNMSDILLCSDRHFFDYTLFNMYSAIGRKGYINGFLSKKRIVEDLGPMYDVIGGNMLSEDKNGMISQILKISGL